MDKENPKSEHVCFRCTREEKRTFRRAARRIGKQETEILRELLAPILDEQRKQDAAVRREA